MLVRACFSQFVARGLGLSMALSLQEAIVGEGTFVVFLSSLLGFRPNAGPNPLCRLLAVDAGVIGHRRRPRIRCCDWRTAPASWQISDSGTPSLKELARVQAPAGTETWVRVTHGLDRGRGRHHLLSLVQSITMLSGISLLAANSLLDSVRNTQSSLRAASCAPQLEKIERERERGKNERNGDPMDRNFFVLLL